jgi:hypothetical protein
VTGLRKLFAASGGGALLVTIKFIGKLGGICSSLSLKVGWGLGTCTFSTRPCLLNKFGDSKLTPHLSWVSALKRNIILHLTFSKLSKADKQVMLGRVYTKPLRLSKGAAVGNGQSINLWEDNWLAWKNGYKTLTPNNRNTNITKVCDIMVNQPCKCWNIRLIDNTFLPFEGDIIKQTPLIMEDMDDILMWPHSTEGTYTVRSGYNLLWLSGKKQIILALLTLTTTTCFGRSYCPSPLSLSIKPFCGGSFRGSFLLGVS